MVVVIGQYPLRVFKRERFAAIGKQCVEPMDARMGFNQFRELVVVRQ